LLYSGERKRALSGWLKKNHEEEFFSSLKLQKFLFFYEALTKVEGEQSDFSSLKGYINGPVFSDIYGDYTYRKDEFSNDVETTYLEKTDIVNENRAKFSGFLVKILNENELSEITHELNIWKSKIGDIERGVRQIPLSENDFTEDDADLLVSLRDMYSSDYIDSVRVIQISGKSFVINKTDIEKLTDDQEKVFISLANEDSLENPVYVSVSEDGVVLVD